jgi:hypothetical protein
MIRVRIKMTKREHSIAKREAARLGISLVELLRRSLRTALPVNDTKPWMRYAGMVQSGDSASSRHIDDLVYGRKG